MTYEHTPVLFQEVIENLQIKKGDVVLDGTIGGAGHAIEMLKQVGSRGKLIGFDLDTEALKTSDQRLKKISNNYQLINDNYSQLEKYGQQFQFLSKVSAILLDLGVSSNEIGNAGRGFSFQKPLEPLDLRMKEDSSLTASEILNNYSEEEIRKILQEYGEEPLAKKISRRVVSYRKTKRIETVADLLQILNEAYRGAKKPKKIHQATRTWQALRIAVNDELNSLKKFLPAAVASLKPGGRIAIISFHSLEDRIVKQFFKKESLGCLCPKELPLCVCHHQPIIKILTKKPIIPNDQEIINNPRSRSAKLRLAQKK